VAKEDASGAYPRIVLGALLHAHEFATFAFPTRFQVPPIYRLCVLTKESLGMSHRISKESGALTHDVEQSILFIRGEKVILDYVLARMYGVTTGALVQAVRRNPGRFPDDFMYQLSPQEVAGLKSQFVISNSRGGRRGRPYAFTEQGVAMLSSVLRSERAVLVNVEIMRAFVRLRRLLITHADLARKLEEFGHGPVVS